VKHYVSSFLQKEILFFFGKRPHYVKGLESREIAKESTYIYFQHFIDYIFHC